MTPPNKKAPWKKLPEAVRREAIINAAQSCFATKGYADTSVNDIAVAAGLTKGGIYFHFSSKEEIRLALINEFTAGVLQQVKALLNNGEKPLQQLEQLVLLLLDRMAEEQGLLLTLTEAVTRHGAAIDETRQYYLQLSGYIAQIIEAGRQAGQFETKTDLNVVVELVLTIINGTALHRELDKAGINLCQKKQAVLQYLWRIVSV